MRPASILPCLAVAACLVGPPALAQQPGWVDPPARPPSAETAPGPAAEEARKSAEGAPPRGGTGHSAMPARQGPAVRAAAEEAPDRPTRAQAAPLERSALALARDYLATVSGEGMAEAAPRFYGGWVRFHDRLISLRTLMAEKRRFARRWPERRYAPHGALHAACSEAARTCIVRGTVSFEAASAQRGRRSAGLAEIALTITLAGERPLIVAETSRVVRRGLASGAEARFIPAG